MDLTKLEALSTDALCAMRDKCAEILRSRSVTALRRGAKGWFLASSGEKVFVRIDRINQKTLSCTKLNADTLAPMEGHRWKVSPQMVTIIGTRPAAKPVATPAYVPQSVGVDQW